MGHTASVAEADQRRLGDRCGVGTGWGGLAGSVTPLFLLITATGFIVASSIAGALDGFWARSRR